MTEFSIIPRVSIAELPVLNVSTKQIEIIKVNQLYPSEEILTFNRDPQGGALYYQLKEFLLYDIIIRLEDGKHGKGLNDILGLSESPPRFVAIEDVEEWVLANQGSGVSAQYVTTKIDSVDHRGNRPLSDLKFTRIFLSAPLKIRYNKCEFFQPDPNNLLYTSYRGKKIEASCGFQYFYQEFGGKSNYSKFFGKPKCEDVVQKIKVWANKDPPQFEDWCSFYKGHEFVKNQNLSKIKPVPDWIDLDSLMREVPELKVVDFKEPEYTSEEEYNSLNLLDIIKLCMWSRLNLVMTDDLDQVYLSYIDDKYNHPKGKRKKRGCVVVKIIDNHGYFVIDANVKHSAINRSISFDGMYDRGLQPQREIDKSKCNDTKDDFFDTGFYKHPLAMFKHGDLQYDWSDIDWWSISSDTERAEVCSAYRKKIIMEACREEVPPTPEQLVEFMEKDTPTILYVGNSRLNGFVDWMMRHKGVKPDYCQGLAHTIHKATYGKLKVLAYHHHPETRYTYDFDKLDGHDGKLAVASLMVENAEQWDASDDELEQVKEYKQAEIDCWEWWRETYEILKETPLPTPAKMANAVYDELYDTREFHSRFNICMKDIFYNCEIKPEFRVEKPSGTDSRHGFSLDFSKAYTKAMKLMDCEWSVFDAIDEPRKFKTFNPDNFYICSQSTGQGLVLRHGCYLRQKPPGLKPIYEIGSHKKLPRDYFAIFADKCYEIAGDGKNNVVSGKSLVNNFIGTLKRKDGIYDYRLTINQDKLKSRRNLFEGYIVSNLNDNSKFRWRGNTYLTAKPQLQYHYLSGQPIRLQIIDRINEMNLLLFRAYRQALRPFPNLYEPHLAMVKTDALYLEYPCKTERLAHTQSQYCWRKWDFNPDQILDEINKSLPDGYDVKIERRVIWMDRNDKGGYKFDGYDTREPDQTQRQVKFTRNRWKQVWDIKHKWKVSGCLGIIKYICVSGGGFIEGEAGTGKTEIIKTLDDIVAVNRKLYRWVRIFYKLTQPKTYYELCEDWRNIRPVYIKKLAPTNKACNNIKGMTLHKGLGLRIQMEEEDLVEDEEDKPEEQPINFIERIVASMEGDGRSRHRTDIIVVDEISMMGGEMWSALNYIKLRIPTIKFILCGDIKRQLPPVKEERRQIYHARVVKELTNHNKIILHYNFRRKGDRNELWEDWSLQPERFLAPQTEVDGVLSKRNLCFTNKKRKEIINLVQNSLDYDIKLKCMNPKDYKSDRGQQTLLKIGYGTPLIARKSISELEVAKNEIWSVKYIHTEQGELTLRFDEKEDIRITYKECIMWFLSAYCITIHKAQGDTYDDEYTIHEWNKMSGQSLFLRRLRYVAQSRSTNPKELIRYRN